MRKKFYDSNAWRSLRNEYAKEQDFICEECGRPCYNKNDYRYIRLKKQGHDVMFGIVHHIEHLDDYKINDRTISLDKSNLQFLCIVCHNQVHSETAAKPEVREDVKFNEMGDIIHGS